MGTKKLWFKAKDYGWGWTPSTWQGWVAVVAEIIVLAAADYLRQRGKISSVIFFLICFVSAFVLILVSYKKGEKPSWRWGKK